MKLSLWSVVKIPSAFHLGRSSVEYLSTNLKGGVCILATWPSGNVVVHDQEVHTSNLGCIMGFFSSVDLFAEMDVLGIYVVSMFCPVLSSKEVSAICWPQVRGDILIMSMLGSVHIALDISYATCRSDKS